MRKAIYIIIFITSIVGFVGFWEIQQLKSKEFKEGFVFFIDRVLDRDKYSGANDIYKRNEKRKSNILEIAFALNCYKKDNDSYPDKPEISGSLTQTGIFSEDIFINPIYPEYLNNSIKDPINNSSHHYTYIVKNDNFVLFSRLEGAMISELEEGYYCFDSINKNPIIVYSNPSINMRCE